MAKVGDSFLTPRLEQHELGTSRAPREEATAQDSGSGVAHRQSPNRGFPLYGIAGANDDLAPLDIHVHRELEVGIVVSGEEEIHFFDHLLTCHPGEVWLCTTDEPHGWRFGKTHAQNAVLLFTPEFIGEELLGGLPWMAMFVVPPSQRPQLRSPEARRQALALGRTLRREIEEGRPDWEEVVRFELLHLLLLLKREWGASRPGVDQAGHSSLLARVLPAVALTHSTPWRRISVVEAAAACGLSRSHFQSLFQRAMGVSFGRFALRSRLSYVAHRVANTDRTVAAIAAEAGFTDDSHLHRRFRQQYHRTPRDYRADAREAGGRGEPKG